MSRPSNSHVIDWIEWEDVRHTVRQRRSNSKHKKVSWCQCDSLFMILYEVWHSANGCLARDTYRRDLCEHGAFFPDMCGQGGKSSSKCVVISSFRVALLKRTEARLGQRPCHRMADHTTPSAGNPMRSRVSTFVGQALKADSDRERLRAQM